MVCFLLSSCSKQGLFSFWPQCWKLQASWPISLHSVLLSPFPVSYQCEITNVCEWFMSFLEIRFRLSILSGKCFSLPSHLAKPGIIVKHVFRSQIVCVVSVHITALSAWKIQADKLHLVSQVWFSFCSTKRRDEKINTAVNANVQDAGFQ